jgi:hypothetical protein
MLLGLVGGDLVDVLHAPAGLDIPVVAVLIHDSSTVSQTGPGDLLLAIGIHPDDPDADHLLANLGPDITIAFKARDDTDRERLRRLAVAADVTVLAIVPEMSWDQLYVLARRSIASAASSVPSERGGAFGDLFALANSAAATLEGPVIINDERMEVIAFSSLGDEIDDLRQRSILQRRPPKDILAWCWNTGLLPRVRQTPRPLRVVPPDGAPRLVSAIRGGTDVLGYIWVMQADREFDQHSEDLLAEIARVAAVQLVRARVSEDLDRRVRSDLLRSALSGRGNPAAVAARLGVPGAARLVSFAPDHTEAPSGSDDQVAMRLVEDLVALRVEAAGRRGAVTMSNGIVYALFPAPDDRPAHTVVDLAKEIVGQADRQLASGLRAAVSRRFADLAQIADARRDIDRLMHLPLLDEARRVICFEDSIAEAVMSEFTELIVERPQLLQGGVAGMAVSDRDRGTEYLPSLRAFFGAGGDVAAAARTLFVHRNTLRYRLTRMRDAFGVDVEDATQRLVAELQLAVLTAHPELLAGLGAGDTDLTDRHSHESAAESWG